MTIATEMVSPLTSTESTSTDTLPEDNKSLSTMELLKHAARLARNYFLQSDQRYKALLLLAGVIVTIVALVALTYVFTTSMLGFWLAFETMSVPLLLDSLATILATSIAYISINFAKNYFMETLIINWRQWLTKDLLNNYTDKQYVKLSRMQFKNAGQRIEKDVKSVVRQTISLSMDLLQQTLNVVIFIGALWVAGGALSFTVLGLAIVIPGYLVWAAILFAGLSALITQAIAQTLTPLTNKDTTLGADFRRDMEFMDNNAESIAMRRSEGYHKRLFGRMLDAIGVNSAELIWVKTKLAAFQDFYMQISWIFPYVIAAPRYFAGKISMGQLNQIGYAFGQVQFSLSWFVNSYGDIARYKTSMERLVELEKAMQADAATTPKIFVHKTQRKFGQKQKEKLNVVNLDIAKPQGTEFIRRNLNLTIEHGKHVLIKDKSGAGKSTLFKVLAETWGHGSGKVTIPYHHKMRFLSQTPIIPSNTCTLKAVLAYPWPVETYEHDEYENMLRELDMAKFIYYLDTNADWSKSTLLSGGQRQRIAFAQVLLEKDKPHWLFLDEATSALDSEDKNGSVSGEHLMYNLLKKYMKGTTIVGIAHGATAERFYDKVITLDANAEPSKPRTTKTATVPATEHHRFFPNKASSFLVGSTYPVIPKKPSSMKLSQQRMNGLSSTIADYVAAGYQHTP